MRIAQEEIFGPVVSVIPFSNFDEALEIANGVSYGLSSSLYTRNINNAYRAMRDLETGIVYINAPTIGAETHLPFGGIKNTGNGHRESGLAALDFYSEWKSIYVDYSDKLQRAQIDNEARTQRTKCSSGLQTRGFFLLVGPSSHPIKHDPRSIGQILRRNRQASST